MHFLALSLLKKIIIFSNTFLFFVPWGGALDIFINSPLLAWEEGSKFPLIHKTSRKFALTWCSEMYWSEEHLLHRQIEKSSSVSMVIIYWGIFKIFKKSLKNKNCSKFIMKVMLRKSLVLKIKKTQTKTFMASKHDLLEIKHIEFFLLSSQQEVCMGESWLRS